MDCSYYKGLLCDRPSNDIACPCVTYIADGGSHPGMLVNEAINCKWKRLSGKYEFGVKDVYPTPLPLMLDSEVPQALPSAVDDSNDNINHIKVTASREKIARLISIMQASAQVRLWEDIFTAGYEYRNIVSSIPLYMIEELPKVMREEELLRVQVETLIDYPPADDRVFDKIFRDHLETLVCRYVLTGKR